MSGGGSNETFRESSVSRKADSPLDIVLRMEKLIQKAKRQLEEMEQQEDERRKGRARHGD